MGVVRTSTTWQSRHSAPALSGCNLGRAVIDNRIQVRSAYAYNSREPLVEVDWAGQKVQLTLLEARRHAFNLLSAAEASESDAFILAFVEERLGAELDEGDVLLNEFRRFRAGRAELE